MVRKLHGHSLAVIAAVGGGTTEYTEAKDKYSEILYGEKFRGILALRSESSELTTKNGKMVKARVEQFGDTVEI